MGQSVDHFFIRRYTRPTLSCLAPFLEYKLKLKFTFSILQFPKAKNPIKMKPSVGLVIFATVMAFCIIMDGVVAPFPRDDPRSILNPLILPWWNVAPLHVKQIAHLIGTGKPLPAEQAVPRRRVNRP